MIKKSARIPVLSDILNPGGDAPQVGTVNVDRDTDSLINEASADARRPLGDITQETLAGTNAISDRLNQDQMLATGGLEYNPTMGTALANRYSRVAGSDIEGLKKRAEQASRAKKADRLRSSFQMVMARNQVKSGAYQRLLQAESNRQAARAEVMRSLIGLGGAVAGGAFGGAPGAMAGSQAGSVVAGPSQPQQPIGHQQGYLGGNQMAGNLDTGTIGGDTSGYYNNSRSYRGGF